VSLQESSEPVLLCDQEAALSLKGRSRKEERRFQNA